MSEFDILATRIRACRICVDTPSGRPLPHPPRPVLRGAASARILIAGQAPGTRVHASGVPFTDPSGDRLRAWMGVDEATFYDIDKIAIVPMGFCFPGLDAKGSDLPPRRECAPAWRAEVLAALPTIQIVLAIGLYAQRWHLGAARGADLTQTVADWRRLTASGRPQIWPLPHPSWRNTGWLKKNPWFEMECLPAMRAAIAGIIAI
jgi:uracil-DNA glycosylase